MDKFLEFVNSNIITSLAIILFSGIIFAKIINKFKLPNVTGYLIGGIIIGPYCLKLVTGNNIIDLGIINDIALGFIAFSIGSEFKKDRLKQAGWRIIVITTLEAYVASIVTFVGLYYLAHQSFEFSIIAAAIASATAPAATIMVVKQYKAKGLFVDTLLQVVALDDAAAIIAFSVAIAIAQTTLANTTMKPTVLIGPFVEIFGAALLGVILGLILCRVNNKAKTNEAIYAFTMAMILFCVGIALSFKISSLIACMVLGGFTINFSKSEKPFILLEGITGPLFMAFFVVSGLSLNLKVLQYIGVAGVVYILFRSFGKMLGAYLGCLISKYPKSLQNWLGVALIPQAGVAIGLSAIAEKTLAPFYPTLATELRTMILVSTVVYELLGPLLAKIALYKAGTISNQ